MIGPVLVIDDDPDVLLAARVALGKDVAQVETAQSPQDVGPGLAERRLEAILLDMNFVTGETSGREGLSHLARLHDADPTLAIVLMTTFGGVALAVDALKQGASDFVLKPWRNARLVEALTAATEKTRLARAEAGAFSLEDAECAVIRRALDHHRGNITRAASALGLTRPALYRKMAKHGL
jgi:DNA-binding NtrC family response regulator